MKRYCVDGHTNAGELVTAQFPANNKDESILQGARHAQHLGLEKFRVAYVGKWRGDEHPNTYIAVKQ